MKTYIVLFDGICNLCNSTVQFIIKRDKNNVFKFSSLQSEFGQNFLKERNLSSTDFNSIILYEPGVAYYTKSTAILKIVQKLGFPYKILSVFLLIPSPIRDSIYSLLSKNRYHLFGKKDSCMVPTPENKKKFI
ncbi:Predicted thiol-disulfide oxidoreductase YuxK, DCC family [Apibacter mensalis]|uniref:Predicted thiol-disulfide oxidoreductase YuxK, DCC family n=1 Tax=Apibacter mensalis TaxID=1586267 RepID=A0A0X3AQD6_9FLAO|nr:DCC1-like thiol-disulfide oxidoreductase family protein [Apibacter mensalis]CVK16591.1 Predicted thiol-disulfide oxidoreductase YuxK, DCC family [Apibacter mensalis]